jgi:hypothetical protein
MGTSAVLPARFCVDRMVAKLYFARNLSAALATSSNPRPLLERRMIGICIGSDRAADAGLETTNGTTPSASSAKTVVAIIAARHRYLERQQRTHAVDEHVRVVTCKMTVEKHPAFTNIEYIPHHEPIQCKGTRCHGLSVVGRYRRDTSMIHSNDQGHVGRWFYLVGWR